MWMPCTPTWHREPHSRANEATNGAREIARSFRSEAVYNLVKMSLMRPPMYSSLQSFPVALTCKV